MNLKKLLIIILIFLIASSLTGCWDNRDLTELGIATAVGINKTGEGDIELTVQIVKPGIIKAKTQGSQEDAYWTFSSTGQTVFSAIRNLLTTVNRKVFFRHVDLMIIGEDIARNGILNVLDFFERDHETRRKATVVIAKGIKAKEILTAKSELENIPAMHISAILENNKALAKIVNVNLIDTLRCMNCQGYSPAIGVIMKGNHKSEQKEQGNNQGALKQESLGKELAIRDLKVEGAAIFKKDKLIGWLDPIETRGLLFARNEVQSGIINTANPLEKDKQVAFEIVRSSGKMDVELKDDKLKLVVEVKAEGRLGDQQGKGDLTTSQMIKKLEEEVGEIIKKEIEETMRLAQEKYKSDFFGFAPIVHRKYFDYWKKVENNWEQVFNQAEVKVKATWKTRSSALIKQPRQAR